MTMMSEKENTINPPADAEAIVDDEDDEAFLPPDFLKPEAQHNSTDFLAVDQQSFHDDYLLQRSDNVENDVSVDLLHFDSPVAQQRHQKDDEIGSDSLAVDKPRLEQPHQNSKAPTLESKPADQELNLKLDALTADLEAELQRGNLLLDQVGTPTASVDPASPVEGAPWSPSFTAEKPVSDVAVNQEQNDNASSDNVPMNSIDAATQTTRPTTGALGEAKLMIEQLEKEKEQLATRLLKASDEAKSVKLNAASEIDNLHEQYHLEIDLLQQQQETTLRETTARVELLASQATLSQEASEHDKGTIRHLQRRMGALQSDLREQVAEDSAEDKSKIRHLQRLLGALESDLQEQTQSIAEHEHETQVKAKLDKGTIRSLQRRLGSLHVALQESVTEASAEEKGKLRSLQRRIGALEIALQEQGDTAEATIKRDADKIVELQQRIEELELDAQVKRVEMEEAAKHDKNKLHSLQRHIGELKDQLQQQTKARIEVEATFAKETEQDQSKIYNLQKRIGILESSLQEKTATMELEATKQHELQQGRIRSLQRRLGASREAQDISVEALTEKDATIRSLQRRTGALESDLQASHDQQHWLRLSLEESAHQVVAVQDELSDTTNEKNKLKENVLKELLELESAHQQIVQGFRANEERVAAVGREAMNEVNKMTSTKINELQVLVDRRQTEHEEVMHSLTTSLNEALEEAESLKTRCRFLEEDLQATLEREDQLQEEYVEDLTFAKQRIEELEAVHSSAMGQMKEQYDLVEEELFEALEREDEMKEEHELLIAQLRQEKSDLQSILRKTEESSGIIKEEIAAAMSREKLLSNERDEALVRVTELDLLHESQKKQAVAFELEVQKQLESQEEEILHLHAALAELTENMNEEGLACQVDLFRRCYEYFQAQKDQPPSAPAVQKPQILTIEEPKLPNVDSVTKSTNTISIDLLDRQFTPIEQLKTSDFSKNEKVIEDPFKNRPIAQPSSAVFTDIAPISKSLLENEPKHPTAKSEKTHVAPMLPTTSTKPEDNQFSLQSPTSAFVPCLPNNSHLVSSEAIDRVKKMGDHSTPFAKQEVADDKHEQNSSSYESMMHAEDSLADHQELPGFTTPRLDLKARLQEKSTAKRTVVPLPANAALEVKATPLTSRLKRHLTTTKKVRLQENISESPIGKNLATDELGVGRTPSSVQKRRHPKIGSTGSSMNPKARISNRKPLQAKTGNGSDINGRTPGSCRKPETSSTTNKPLAKQTSSSLKQPMRRSGLSQPSSRIPSKAIGTSANRVEASARRTRQPEESKKLVGSTSMSRLMRMTKSSSRKATDGLDRNSSKKITSSKPRTGVITNTKPVQRESRVATSSGLRKPTTVNAAKIGAKPKSRLSQYGPKRSASLKVTTAARQKIHALSTKSSAALKKTENARKNPRSDLKTKAEEASNGALSQEHNEPSAIASRTDVGLPSALEFHLRTAEKSSKRDQSRPYSGEKSLQVRPTPCSKASQMQSHFTPLMVRNDVIDMFSPEELLVSPVEKKDDERMGDEKRSHAAVAIQKIVRRYLSKCRRSRVYSSTVFIQAIVRVFLARCRQEKLSRVNLAAKLIQSSVRGFLARKRFAKMKEQELAARRIQRYWLMRRQTQEFHRLQYAAVSIQRIYRGKNGRILARRDRALTLAAVCIQNFWRSYSLNRKYYIQRQAAVTIQTLSRIFSARRQASTMQIAAITMQLFYRRRLALRMYRHQKALLLSALWIQKSWRMTVCQRDFGNTRKAAILLQSWWRMKASRRTYESTKISEVSVKSAVQIQKYLRMAQYRFKYLLILRSIITIQAVARGFSVRRCERIRSCEKAAVSIQADWRMRVCRNNFCKELARRKLAAVYIQKNYRKICGRRAWVARQRAFEEQRVLTAVVRIQSYCRMVERRRDYKMTLQNIATAKADSAIRIQNYWRMKTCLSQYKSSIGAIVQLQALVRGVIDRQIVEKKCAMTCASVQIQSFWRMFSNGSQYASYRRSAIQIQSFYRGVADRRLAVAHRETLIIAVRQDSTIRIQSYWRMKHCRSQYKSSIGAIVRLQALVRGVIDRKIVEKNYAMTYASIQIQSFWRMSSKSSRYASFRMSTIQIQSIYRGAMGRRHAFAQKEMLDAALHIQSFWRMAVVRRDYELLYQAAELLQATVRGLLVRRRVKELMKNNATAVFLQSQWRKYVCQLRFYHARHAVLRLQAFSRAVLTQRKVHEQLTVKRAATKIQSCWRASFQRREFASFLKTVVLMQAYGRGRITRLRKEEHKNANEVVPESQDPEAQVPAEVRKLVNPVTSKQASQSKPNRKVLGEVSAATKRSSRRSERNALKESIGLKPSVSPLKTRSGTKIQTSDSGNENTVNRENSEPSQNSKNSGKMQDDRVELRSIVEKLKVVDLREELRGYGIESKIYRKLRKTELVTMVVGERESRLHSH